MSSVILSTGSALPKQVITNDDLAQRVDTSDEWIFSRTGIKSRHIAEKGEYTSTLATAAAKDALKNANLDADELDLIIVATTTPDYSFPSVACQVQGALGVKNFPAFDIQAACTGFLYAMQLADNMLKLGQAKNALIIGAETFSNLVNWDDRRTCVLFGDGAGAVLLQNRPEAEQGIVGMKLSADGEHVDILRTDTGISVGRKLGTTQMKGQEVFKLAVRNMSEVSTSLLKELGVKPEDVDYFIPHQANSRIIEAIAKHAGIPMEKVIMTVSEHANTSAASIPLALDKTAKSGILAKDDMLFLLAFGAGLTWGGALIKWGY